MFSRSKNSAPFKMEPFLTIVKGWIQSTIVAKSSISNVIRFLNPLLESFWLICKLSITRSFVGSFLKCAPKFLNYLEVCQNKCSTSFSGLWYNCLWNNCRRATSLKMLFLHMCFSRIFQTISVVSNGFLWIETN